MSLEVFHMRTKEELAGLPSCDNSTVDRKQMEAADYKESSQPSRGGLTSSKRSGWYQSKGIDGQPPLYGGRWDYYAHRLS